MSAWRFLLDENMPPALRDALRRRLPSVEVLRVGDDLAPPVGSSDPETLQWLSSAGYALLTFNRRTMPAHLDAHVTGGGHVAGVFVLDDMVRLGRLIDDIALVALASEPDEYADQITHVPLQPTGRWPGAE